MFHFPAFPPHTLCVQVRVTPHNWCRVSPFGHPGITARLTAPPGLSRPPTSFIGSWCQGIHRLLSATSQQRCSRPLCNSQTTTNPTNHTTTTHPHPPQGQKPHDKLSSLVTGQGPEPKKTKQPRHNRANALVPSGPNRMSEHSPPAAPTRVPHPQQGVVLTGQAVAGRSFTSVSANEHPTNTLGWCGPLTHFRGKVLLRKEVIQPHLPVRLPCYDFVPIASPTFDGSLPYGLGHRLRVLPTFVT